MAQVNMGGLLKFVTRDPSAETVSGRVQAGFADTYNGSGSATTCVDPLMCLLVTILRSSERIHAPRHRLHQ